MNDLQVFNNKSLSGKYRARLPEGIKMKWAVESAFAQRIISADQKLQNCQPESIQQAMLSAAMIGLSLNPDLGMLYLVPRGGKATLLVSYKGMMEVVNRTGQVLSVKAKVIYSNEPFEYIEGTTTEIRHKVIPDASKRGSPVGSYCVARLADGELMVEYMDSEQLGRVKQMSESKNSGYSPWNKWPEEMMKKAVVRRAWKYWPKSAGLDSLVEVMNTHEGINFNEVGRQESAEPVVLITGEQANELHAIISDNKPDADAGKWLSRLARSMGEENIEDLPADRFEEAKGALLEAVK